MRSMLMGSAPRPQFRLISSVVVTDHSGGILLVQEAKPGHHGQWNLPGGHVEHGESPRAAAERELREETGLRQSMRGFIGVFVGPQSIRFAFSGGPVRQPPIADDEVMATRFFTIDQIDRLRDQELVRSTVIREIVRVFRSQSADQMAAQLALLHSADAPVVGTSSAPLRPCG